MRLQATFAHPLITVLAIFTGLAFSTTAASRESSRHYLSGTGSDDAIPWAFRLEHGRGSGDWTEIPVPSNWELQGFGDYEYISVTQNRGFYKTTFDLPEGSENQRILLFFDGVLTQAHVHLNGKSLGTAHQGGYYRFSYDITGVAKPTGNLLEVTVQKMADDPALDKTHRGDFWNFSGIYRPVYLEVVPQEHIDWFAVHGDMDGSFKLDVYPNHVRAADRIRATVTDSDGKPIGDAMVADLQPGQSKASLGGHFPDVNLWSDEFPNLYRVEVDLLAGDTLVHRKVDRFGFRRFENIPGKGFFLNGRRFVVKAVARQNFWPDTGRTLTEEIDRGDVELMKNFLNLNFVRSAHCDPSERFLDICDELGILVATELNGWVSPMPTEPGRRLIKALVKKDANHPSIVQWNNGNHVGSNPELISEWARWDPQNRMVIRNEGKNYPRVPGIETFGDEAIDARYYPDWKTTTERLAPGKKNTFFPNEVLHALYDGGGGAALHDYYRAIRNSDAGGGLTLWSLLDEGVVRTDITDFQAIERKRFRPQAFVDKQGNRAPDGIVGPYRELEGSAYATREIFSPIQFQQQKLPSPFDGKIEVANEYVFTSLDLVTFEWEILRFPSPAEPEGETRILHSGSLAGPNLQPGEVGFLNLELPLGQATGDALRVRAIGRNGAEITSKTWATKSRSQLLAEAFPRSSETKIEGGGFQYTSGGTTFSFNPSNGMLTSATRGARTLTFQDGPQFVWSVSKGAEVENNEESIDVGALRLLGEKTSSPEIDVFDSPWTPHSLDMGDWVTAVSEAQGQPTIESTSPDGKGFFLWTILGDGAVQLDYRYELPRGLYGYAGIAFNLQEDSVESKRWLGAGPTRVWKNRLHGPELGLFENDHNDGIPGEVWDLPAFKGAFKDVVWASVRTTSGTLTAGLADEDDFFGILKPNNGFNPRRALWSYPPEGGLFIFEAISPVGAKWRDSREAGPSSASNLIDGPIEGTVYFRITE